MALTLKPGSRELLAQAQELLATIGLTAAGVSSLALAIDIDDELNDPEIWEKRPTSIDEAYEQLSDSQQSIECWHGELDEAFTHFIEE